MTNFDDLGQVTLTEDFNWAHVDQACFSMTEQGSGPIEAACECQRRIWEWVYQAPCEDLDGFHCRCIVACWIFVPQLRSYTMTEVAKRFGKKKQSLGRWVAILKRDFPDVTHNMEHIRDN